MRDVLRNRWLLLILLLAAAGFAISQSSMLQGALSPSGRFHYFTPQESEAGITVVKGKYTVMSCAGRGTFSVFSDALRAASGSISVLAHQYPRQKFICVFGKENAGHAVSVRYEQTYEFRTRQQVSRFLSRERPDVHVWRGA